MKNGRTIKKEPASNLKFIREFKKNKTTVGSVIPSGEALSAAMANEILKVSTKAPLKILEIGPGSGVISEKIFKLLHEEDSFTIVELNKVFFEHTRARMNRLKKGNTSGPKLLIQNSDILKIDFQDTKFDVIICSLPFNNFDIELIDKIFKLMLDLIDENGRIVFFEYLLMRRVAIWSSFGLQRRLARVETILTKYISKFGIAKLTVWKNFPPARIYILSK